MSFKKLHSFVVKIEKEVEKTETRQENGQEITVKTKVMEKVPHTIVLKQPTRKEKQNLSVFYSVQNNKAVEMGLLPKAVIVQKFLKDSGDDKERSEMYKKLESLRNDYLRVGTLEKTEENEKRQEAISDEFISLQKKVSDIESSYSSLFGHTAENHAQNRAITWLVLFLSHIEKDGNLQPLFVGETFDKKEESLFDLEDSDDKIYFEAIDRLSYYFSLYFTGRANTTEDFKVIEENYEKELALEKEEEEKLKKEEEELEKQAEENQEIPPVEDIAKTE